MKKFKALFSAICMSLFIMSSITAYADETQTYSWVQEGEVWKLKDAAGNMVVNSWYKDTDGSYYYLGADGVMQDGMLSKNEHYYYLGQDGKMVATDGIYNGVSLVFDKDSNSATYGAILSGAQELMLSGIKLINAETNSTTNNTTTSQSQVQNSGSSRAERCNVGNKEQTADAQSLNRAFTQEELARMKEALDQIR